jgi:hypothetical protein
MLRWMVGYSPLDYMEKKKIDSLGYEGFYDFSLWLNFTCL